MAASAYKHSNLFRRSTGDRQLGLQLAGYRAPENAMTQFLCQDRPERMSPARRGWIKQADRPTAPRFALTL